MNLDYEQYKVCITMLLFSYSHTNVGYNEACLACEGMPWATIITYRSLLLAVLGIRDILLRIRILGAVPLTIGSADPGADSEH